MLRLATRATLGCGSSRVREAERYLLPLMLTQFVQYDLVAEFNLHRISLLSRSYYIMKLGLDSNQHTHHSRCVRPSVIYLSTTGYSPSHLLPKLYRHRTETCSVFCAPPLPPVSVTRSVGIEPTGSGRSTFIPPPYSTSDR